MTGVRGRIRRPQARAHPAVPTQEIRGQVVDGDGAHFQVMIRIGFRVDD